MNRIVLGFAWLNVGLAVTNVGVYAFDGQHWFSLAVAPFNAFVAAYCLRVGKKFA